MGPWETVEIGHDTRIKKWIDTETAPFAGKEVDKISRYGWTIADKIGQYKLIKKQELQVGHYQRELNNQRVLRLANEWSWIACGAIIVAHREGIYYIIEGQHRVAAAMKRSDITELPCLIFEVENVKQEAEGFYRSNVYRKNATPAERLMPLVDMGDPTAIGVLNLINSSGRNITKTSSPTSIACVSALMTMAQRDLNTLKHLWPLFNVITHKKIFHERLLMGLFYIEKNMPNDMSLMDTENYNRLIRIGYDALMEGIRRANIYFGLSTPKICAMGILDVFNKRLKNKLELKGD